MKGPAVPSAVLVFLLFSCISQGTPGWVKHPPVDSATGTFFTGLGTSETGDEAEARNLAVYALVAEITRYLGVNVTSDLSVQARDTLEEFQSVIEQNIRQTSQARLKDFRIIETYVEHKGLAVTVHLLGEFERQSLEAEKRRIQRVFEEQQEAVGGPELEGDILLSSGQQYQALLKYIDAAGAAARSDLQNRDIKFERNINKAKSALAALRISVKNGDVTIVKDSALPVFEITVENTVSVRQTGVSLRVSYRELSERGRFATRTTTLTTGKNGSAVFTLPAPSFVGEESVRVAFDLRASMDTFTGLSNKYRDLAGGIETAANARYAEFRYKVVSPLAGMRLVVAGMDMDSGGNVFDTSHLTIGIMEALTASDFIVVKSSIHLRSKTPAENALAAATALGIPTGRVMIGEAEVLGFSEEDGKSLVRVSGTGYLVDIATGNVLYSSSSYQKNAIGSDSQAALVSAFRQLGRLIGDDLVNNLR